MRGYQDSSVRAPQQKLIFKDENDGESPILVTSRLKIDGMAWLRLNA
jgi:hypothetical protein